MNRFQFVADSSGRYGVKRLCEVLDVARSSFYAWQASAPARRARADADSLLAQRIRQIQADSNGTYGAPRVTAELRDRGERVNRKRIARVMRKAGLRGLRLRRRTRTTIPDPAAAKAPDLIGRDFTADAPNARYVGDITYLPVGDRGFLYLATVIDLCSRRLAGWAIADHMRTDLVLDALHTAQRTRGGPGSLDGAILHTDHGAQGEFNWSSQHLEFGGVDGSAGGMDAGVDGQVGDEVAGGAVASAGGRAPVLARDRPRAQQRRGCGCPRRVAAGWHALVPAAWRDAVVHDLSGVRPVSVVCGAGGDRHAEGARMRGAGDRPPGESGSVDDLP